MTNNSGTSYTFTGNGSFTFEFVDQYGNTGEETATVNRIDKTAPYAVSVSYDPDDKTNQDVTVTLVTSEAIQSLTGWSGGGTTWRKVYSANGSETVTFYDLVGNEGSTGVEVNRIDKSAVTGAISYAPSTATNTDVVATISFNKSGVTVTNNGGSTSYTITGNGTFTFEFEDQYGNTGAETATVNRIDKTAPVCGIWTPADGIFS